MRSALTDTKISDDRHSLEQQWRYRCDQIRICVCVCQRCPQEGLNYRPSAYYAGALPLSYRGSSQLQQPTTSDGPHQTRHITNTLLTLPSVTCPTQHTWRADMFVCRVEPHRPTWTDSAHRMLPSLIVPYCSTNQTTVYGFVTIYIGISIK